MAWRPLKRTSGGEGGLSRKGSRPYGSYIKSEYFPLYLTVFFRSPYTSGVDDVCAVEVLSRKSRYSHENWILYSMRIRILRVYEICVQNVPLLSMIVLRFVNMMHIKLICIHKSF